MKHQPPDSDIAVSQTVHEAIELVQYELLSHKTLDEELPTPLVAVHLLIDELLDQILDALKIQDIS